MSAETPTTPEKPKPTNAENGVADSCQTNGTCHSNGKVDSPTKLDLDADVLGARAHLQNQNTVGIYCTYLVVFYVANWVIRAIDAPQWLRNLALLSLAGYIAFNLYLGPGVMNARSKMAIASFGPPDQGCILGTLVLDVTKTKEFIAEQRAKHGAHVTITHVVMRAVGAALAKAPSVNGHIVWGRFFPSNTVDVSCLIAVDGGKDLGVATIRDADKKTTRGICETLVRRSTSLRTHGDKKQTDRNKLVMMLPTWLLRPIQNICGWMGHAVGIAIPALGVTSYMFGSCLITSVGMMGLDLAFAPLTPFAQVPLLVTVGAIRDKAVVVNGEIVVRPMLTITTTIDHRYADGTQCARMAQNVKRFVEDPYLLDPREEE